MKPNFALSLSFDGIGLLHRRFPGWTLVDEVSLDIDDLPAALAELRAKATALDPSGLRTKLVIPNSQIKYLSIPAPATEPHDQAARAALDGATPYSVDELVYDWAADGPDLKIAAVARETLEEAEAFAIDHAFAPVCFVAIPDNGDFKGEPFFGETTQARSILPDGAQVERDEVPIRIISVSKEMPVPPAPPADPGEEAASPAPDTAPAATEPAPVPDKAAPAKQPKPKPEPKTKAKAKAAPKVDAPDPVPDAPKPFTSIRASRGAVSDNAAKLDAPSRLSGLVASRSEGALRPGAADTDKTAAPVLPSPATEPKVDPAQLAQAAASLRPDPAERLDSPTPAEPETTGETAKPRFFSGRQPQAARKTTPTKKTESKPVSSAKTRFEDEKQRMTVFGARQPQVGGKPRFLGLILLAALLLFLVAVAAWASIFLDDGLARLFGGPKEIHVADDVSASAETEPIQPMRVAMPAATEPLAPMAPAQSEETDQAALTLPETPIEPPAAPAAESPAPEPPPEPAPVVSTPAPAPEPLTPSAALARYAATGIWQMAPEPPTAPRASGDAERIFRISVDPDVQFDDPTILPSSPGAQRDAPPEVVALPHTPGEAFDFDENNLVRATPEGAMTPQGVRVHAGRPVVEPPAAMQRVDAPTVTTEPALVAEAEAEPAAVTDQAEPQADAGQPTSPLAALRPRPRPASIAPEAQSQATPDADADAVIQSVTEDEASLPVVDPALAAFRPRVRPDTITAVAEAAATTEAALVDSEALEAALALANADADAEATSEAEAEVDESQFENPTPQAVTASLTPLNRPKNFAAIVARARESEATQPVATAQVLAPSVPSTASVAKEATNRNVLNLRDVNLIGVYGTPNNRRALVRLSNGRYKKVKVGDRLDGGKVAAIGDSELRYVKKGRNVTLRMPKG